MDKGAKSKISVMLTILVIAIYLVPNFAEAVAVAVSTDKAEYVLADTTIKTTLSVTIRANERIPIQDLSLLLNESEICKFNVDGSKITACSGISINRTSAGDYGLGVLNGTDEATSEFTKFGYGYGLENGYTGTLSYNVVINKSTVATGAYTLKLSANAVGSINSHIYSGETTFSVTEKTTMTIQLVQGVSMFSLPLQPESPVTFNDIQSGCAFTQGFTNGISYINPDTGQYVYINGDAVLYPGQSYFTTLQSACQFTIEGVEFNINDVGYLGSGSIKAGWNMIGAPSNQINNFDTVEGSCNVVSGPWGFNAATYEYVRTQTLVPGKGYMIQSTNNCNLGLEDEK